MKNLLTSAAAIAMLAAAPVLAAGQAPAPAASVNLTAEAKASISAAEAEALTGAVVIDANDDNIGEISGFVQDAQTGAPIAALVDVGGFLGMGEHRVALPLDMLTVRRVDDDVTVHVNATAETLKDMPEASADASRQADVMMTADATEELTGAVVFDANDENIGEISGFVEDAQTGAPIAALVDVGGFLGMGEHRVALPLDMLTVSRADDDVTVHVNATAKTLKDMPAHKKG